MRILVRLLVAAFLMVGVPAAGQVIPKPSGEIDQIAEKARSAMVAEPGDAERLAVLGEEAAARLGDARERLLATASFRWMRGEALVRMDNTDAARPLLAQALAMIAPIQEPIKLRADILMSMGTLELVKSNAAEALGNYQQAFNILETIGDRRGQAVALQNLASLYYSGNDPSRAERYYLQAAETYRGDAMLTLSLHNNRGNVLLTMERYADAAKEYAAALEIAKKQNNPLLEVRVLINLARTQVDLKQFAEAGRTLERGFALIEGRDVPVQRRHLLATSARLAADRGDFVRAARLIRECFAGVDLTTTSVDFRNAHVYAHDIFSKIGDTRLALSHLEAIKRLTDESTKVAISTGSALMAARFDYANQQTAIERLKAEEAQRTTQVLYVAVGATLAVIVALAWGLVTVRRSRNTVAAANIVLGETNVALEKALKAKTEFLATTSHEIRTPLNGILGMTQVMLADQQFDAAARDRIGIIHSAGTTMRALVDDILDVAKMENGNLAVEAAPMDFCAVLRDVTRMWEEQALAKGLSFRLELNDAPCWIVSDAGRMRQIIFNLLSNAIKFTEKGGVVVRAVAEGEGDEARLRIAISDTGIGVPIEKADEIFESFRQVDTSTTRKYGGTGLGLTICRNLAQALGGDVRVESAQGSGSTFTLDLPLIPASAPGVATQHRAAGVSMLILDRNPITRSMFKALFEARVATLRFVGTPDEAIAALAEGGVTHLVADEATLKAGDSNPIETLGRVLDGAEIIFSAVLWSGPDEGIISELYAAGIGKVIEKPITGPALVDAIVPQPKENSDSGGSDPLVSRAA